MPKVVKSVTVPALGVGRKDYSMMVEYSVTPQIRSHLLRYVCYGDYYVPGAYADLFIVDPIPFGVPPAFVELTYEAPSTIHRIFEISNTVSRNILIEAGLYEYDSWNDLLAHNYARHFGVIYGYGKANIILSKGFLTVEGKCYAVGWRIYDPLKRPFKWTVVVNGLVDVIAGE